MSAHDGPAHLAWGAVWPSLEEFTELAQSRRVIPVVEKLLIDDAAPTGIFVASRRVRERLFSSLPSMMARGIVGHLWAFARRRS